MTTAATLPLIAGPWEVDPNHSGVSFSVRHLGVSRIRGRANRFRAEIVIGPSPETTSVNATIDLASLDTGNPDRDAHARAADFLDVENRPTLTFRSTAVTGDADRWTVTGDATIGDVTRPLTLDVAFGGIETFVVDSRRHAGFEATGELRRSDFGIAPHIPGAMVSDVVHIVLDLQLLEPAPA